MEKTMNRSIVDESNRKKLRFLPVVEHVLSIRLVWVEQR